MLHNPKWSQPPRPEPTLEGLIEWLERQPAEGTYNWAGPYGDCLIDMYGLSIGYTPQEMCAGPHGHTHYDRCNGHPGSVALPFPWTFPAALLRARAALRLRDTHVPTLERAIAGALTVRVD